jgi:hypothetical protein
VESAARVLLAHASRNRRHVPACSLRSFAGLGNSTGLAVADARLRLRELFDALSACTRPAPSEKFGPAVLDSGGACGGLPLPAPLVAPAARLLATAPQNSLRLPCSASAQHRRSKIFGRYRSGSRAQKITPAPIESRCDAGPSLVGIVEQQRARRARSMARAKRRCVHRCKHARLGRRLERAGSGFGLLRCRERGLQHQRAGASRRHPRSSSIRTIARSRELVLISDSLLTVHIVRNWTSRAPRLLANLRTLRALCESLGVTISTRHPPSVVKLWADRLSRCRYSTSWGLCHTSALLQARRFKAELLDGEGLPPPRAGSYGRPPIVFPRPALLPVWHRHLDDVRRGFMIAPHDTDRLGFRPLGDSLPSHSSSQPRCRPGHR